jgi:hypothetical protein
MLDGDLAAPYGVETKVLVQAVKRNTERFPEDFMFQLSDEEFAFTEQGVAMLSTVLRSARAIEVNIAIMRTFVQLRSMLASNAELAAKLARLEKKYDAQFKVLFDAIRQLMTPPAKARRRIGFAPGGSGDP